MPVTNYDQVIKRLIKEINDIHIALGNSVANFPLYDIANENTPPTLTTNQNNYAPGNYDILRLNSTGNVSITGISGGKKGRRLQLFNVGAYGITLSNLNASSLQENRFSFVNTSDFIIPPSGNVLIYYDTTQSRWIGGDQASIYDTVNETTPAQIVTNQNDYDPGLSEVLRLSTDAARTITGISGGVKGRYLQIINVGNFNITLSYEDASSSAANRFITPSAESTVLYPRASVRLYYDGVSLRWSIPDRPTWTGKYGVSFGAAYGGAAQSIPNSSTTQVTGWSVYTDEWGMFNSAGQKIVIPFTGVYMGVFAGSYDINATGYRMISWSKGGIGIVSQSYPAVIDAQLTLLSCPFSYPLTAGDEIIVTTTQKSGGNLNFNAQQWFLTRVF